MLALASVLVLCGAVAAHADNIWVWETVPMRTSSLTSYSGYVDSSTFCHTYTSQVDTTAWITSTDWAKPPQGNSADSLWAVIVVSPVNTSSVVAKADTFYFNGEVGNVPAWNALTFQPVEPMNLGGGQLGNGATMKAVTLVDSSYSARGVFRLATTMVSAAGGTGAVSYQQLWGTPAFRLRITAKMIGCYQVRVGHWKTVVTQPNNQ